MQQATVIAGAPRDAASSQLAGLRVRANDLKLRVSDLEMRRTQLRETREQASLADRPKYNQSWANANHELDAAKIQLDAVNKDIDELETARDMNRLFTMQGPPSTMATTAPPPDPFLRPSDIMSILGGGAIMLFPLVLVLARRLWVRAAPRTVVDLENSPRLQRMEQAIESIAVEVERIGEAQRFTTKLLSDRQPDAVARMTAPRKEPGVITPH
jgi:hypothetical protein